MAFRQREWFMWGTEPSDFTVGHKGAALCSDISDPSASTKQFFSSDDLYSVHGRISYAIREPAPVFFVVIDSSWLGHVWSP